VRVSFAGDLVAAIEGHLDIRLSSNAVHLTYERV